MRPAGVFESITHEFQIKILNQILRTKTRSAYSLLRLSKFPLLCNYRVITGWKQIFYKAWIFYESKIILHPVLYAAIYLYTMYPSFSFQNWRKLLLGKRRIHRSFLVVAPLETILPAYEKGFTKGLGYPC